MEPNTAAELLASLLPILQVPVSNIGSKTGFYGPNFTVVSLSASENGQIKPRQFSSQIFNI
jgi:hypothetical protein